MRKIVRGLVVLTGFVCFSSAYAAPVATINSLTPPVWVKHNNLTSELTNNSLIERGDHITTGDVGRIEISIEPGILLQVLAKTEIRILRGKERESTLVSNQTDLYVLSGKVCTELSSSSNENNNIKINVGNSLFIIAQYSGEFCVQRQQGLSSIELKAGNVQVKHATSGDLIVLGEVGTEFRVGDDGSYDWGNPDNGGTLTSEVIEVVKELPQAPTKEETPRIQSGVQEYTLVPINESTITAVAPKKPLSVNKSTSAVTYTVYLLSTRSEDAAKQANSKFLKAGYSTEIKLHETGDGIRYHRVVAPDFGSYQSAKEFSDTIVGTLGVTETWIGKSP